MARRLPTRCRPRQSRSGQLALAVVSSSAWAAVAVAACWSEELAVPHRRWIVFGLLGGVLAFLIPALARALRHYGAAGLSSVEVDLRPGRELAYSVLQERGMSRLDVLDARLVCRRVKFRHDPVELWSQELGQAKPHDSLGSRARIEGRIGLPPDAPVPGADVEWSIEVRARFGDGAARVEQFEVHL